MTAGHNFKVIQEHSLDIDLPNQYRDERVLTLKTVPTEIMSDLV